MIEVTRRFFKVDKGEVNQAIVENYEAMKSVNKEIIDFSKSVGASAEIFIINPITGKLTGFMFPDDADVTLFKKLGDGEWAPNRNSKAGKALYTQMKALPERVSPHPVVSKKTGISLSSPSFFYGHKVYFSQLFGLINPDKNGDINAYIAIPWAEVNPDEIKGNAVVSTDSSEGLNSRKELIDWIINISEILKKNESLVEMKYWEIEKELEERRKGVDFKP